jgi:hypothetical protein
MRDTSTAVQDWRLDHCPHRAFSCDQNPGEEEGFRAERQSRAAWNRLRSRRIPGLVMPR